MSASASDRRAARPNSNVAATTPPTLYDLLGVSYTASPAEITRAYRSAMRRSHPDHQSTDRRIAAEEHAKELNAAYATLSKPGSRLAYDQTIQQSVVQDQIMSRYVGGFDTSMASDRAQSGGLQHSASAAERREQALSDRHALMSLLIVFGGITGLVLAGLLLWSIVSTVARALF